MSAMTQNTGSAPPARPPAPLDFAEIEAAVMETERGRWFLGEYARKNRVSDTTMLLEAIAKLENSVGGASQPVEDSTAFRAAICEMAEEIERTKREISELAPGGEENARITGASAELDAIVDSTETATSSILEAAEAVQELAWTLREEGVSDACCDALDLRATEIYTACSFQDITGQRITKVIAVLRMLDNRIGTMAKLWSGTQMESRDAGKTGQHPDAGLLNGPAPAGEAIDQDEVDRMMLVDAGGAQDTADIMDHDFDAIEIASTEPQDSAPSTDSMDESDEASEMADIDPPADVEPVADEIEMIAVETDALVEGASGDIEFSAVDEADDTPVPGAVQPDDAGLSQKDFDALFA